MSFPLLAIDYYRRYLSPRKGFRCAAGVRHGEGSCSDVIRAIVEHRGLLRGWPDIREQFRRCRRAAAELRAEQELEEGLDGNPEGEDAVGEGPQDPRHQSHPMNGGRGSKDKSNRWSCFEDPTWILCAPDPSDCGWGFAGEGLSCGGEAAGGICSCL